MDVLTQLLSQYTGAEIFLLVIAIAVGIKFISELYDWFHDKIWSKYKQDDDQEDKYEKIVNEIQALDTSVKNMSNDVAENNASVRQDITEIKDSVHSINERLLETIRSSIIDKHHKYMKIGSITDFSLQSLERQYQYYKSAGGNSFVDRLMDDIRELPVVDSEDAIGDDGKDE